MIMINKMINRTSQQQSHKLTHKQHSIPASMKQLVVTQISSRTGCSQTKPRQKFCNENGWL